MNGAVDHDAHQLGIEALDFKREDIGHILEEIARRLSRAVQRLRLEGGRRIPDLLQLEKGEKPT
jgi:hypothetical protein